MSTPDRYRFTFKEVTEALLRQSDIKDGMWEIAVEFGLAATNIANSAEEKDNIYPAAIVPIQKFAIVRVERETPLSVDASKMKSRKRS